MENVELKLPIEHATIFVVGAGGTGSQLLPFLTQLLANLNEDKDIDLCIIDGDLFEQKNKRNQKCLDRDIGENKAKVTAERYQRIYSDYKISYYDGFIKTEEDLAILINQKERSMNYVPIIVSCVDNNATRKMLDSIFHKLSTVVYIDSGNGTDNMVGQVVTGLRLKGRTILPPVSSVFPEIKEDKDTIENATGCANNVGEAPQNIATNVMAAQTLFSVLNKLLSFEIIKEHMIFFDAFNSTSTVKTIDQNMIVKG